MKKFVFVSLGFMIAAGILSPIRFVENVAAEGPSIDIHISLPPPHIFIKPPEVIVIPGHHVVVAPHPEVDIFFYSGYWWCPRGERWFRSLDYNGPWKEVRHRYIPDHIRNAPRNYRTVYKHEHRIPYGQWKKQWKHREKTEYKEKTKYNRKENRKEMREEEREDRRSDSHGRGHGGR